MIGLYIDNFRLPWAQQLFKLGEQYPITIFTNNFSEFDVFSKVGVLASHHLWSFPYPVVAGDMFSACYLSKCPIPKRRIFYINYVDWTSNAFNAIDTTNAQLELACQPELEEVVKSVWSTPHIIRNWNYEDIQRILNP